MLHRTKGLAIPVIAVSIDDLENATTSVVDVVVAEFVTKNRGYPPAI